MSDLPNAPFAPTRLRAAFVTISRITFATLVLAGLVNLVIGPRNPAIFVLALFQAGFAWLVLVLADSHAPTDRPFFVGRNGPLFAPWMLFSRVHAGWMSAMVPVFLCLTAAMFLLFTIIISYAVVARIITPAW